MGRLHADFQSGFLTDSITNVATTITSTQFAGLPFVEAPNVLMLVLDPVGALGNPEIVKVTAHVDGATTLTAERGQEDTVARAHAAATVWRHGALASDIRVFEGPLSLLDSRVNADNTGAVPFDAALVVAQALLGPDGGDLYGPPGLYTFDDTLAFSSGVALDGAGKGATVLRGNALNVPLIASDDPTNRTYRQRLSRLTIDNQDRDAAGGVGIDFSNVSLAVIEDVEVLECETGFLIADTDGSYYNRYRDFTVNGAITGMSLRGANSNRFYGARANDCVDGVVLDACSTVFFDGLDCETFTGVGVDILNATDPCAEVVLMNPRLENAGGVGTGIRIAVGTLVPVIIAPFFTGLDVNIDDAEPKRTCLVAPYDGTPWSTGESQITSRGYRFHDAAGDEQAQMYATGEAVSLRNPVDSAYRDFEARNLTARGYLNLDNNVHTYGVIGVPDNALGSNGDFALRGDGGAGNRIYFKTGGAWAAIA